MKSWRDISRAQVAIGILILFHAVGLIGMMTSWQPWFVSLTPLNLLLSAGLLLLNHRDWNAQFLLMLGACLLTGFFVEVAGVKTGAIFGAYSYGATLGWKWLEVPLLISVNWLVLVYCTGVISARARLPRIGQAALAAGMMTALDWLIEPIAMRFDYWDWAGGAPPLQNFIAWFVVALLLLTLFHSLRFEKRNKVAPALYIIQFIFFAVLNLIH